MLQTTVIHGRIWLKTPIPEEWRSSLDSFATVDGTVFPEPPMEEGIAHFCSKRS